MKQKPAAAKPNGLLSLLLDVYDKSIAMRVDGTLVKVAWVNTQPDGLVPGT